MTAAHVISAVECLMDDAVEQEIEEIKALMEEMELDSVEVELEVEVEVDSDGEVIERHCHDDDSEDADSDFEGEQDSDGGEEEEEGVMSGECTVPVCFDDSDSLGSASSCSDDSGASGESDCGTPDSHQYPNPKRKKAVTFSDEVEIFYIEACNGGRKVSELQSPKKKASSSSDSPASKVKKYKLRGKDGPVFVELTEEAAAYLKFIQISREHGHNIIVKDFYKEASDFAKGIMPEFVSAQEEPSTPLKSGAPAGRHSSRQARSSSSSSSSDRDAMPVAASDGCVGGDSTPVKRQHRNKNKASQPRAQTHPQTPPPPRQQLHQQQQQQQLHSNNYSVYVHNGAHYFSNPPTDAGTLVQSELYGDAYALMYGPQADDAYPSADEFAHAMVYGESEPAHDQQLNKFAYYDMHNSKSARAFFSGTGFYDTVQVRDSPYMNNYAQAHRPMRGRGRGQHSRAYQSSHQPYRKQQGRSPRK